MLAEKDLKTIYNKFVKFKWNNFKENIETMKRFLSLGVKTNVIKNSPKLGAYLYIFQYLPKAPKKINFAKQIYAYL